MVQYSHVTLLPLVLATLSSSLTVVERRVAQTKFAVVQPFSMSEVELVSVHSAAIKCNSTQSGMDFVMFYQGHRDDVVLRLNRTVEQVLAGVLKKPFLFQCFKGVRLEYGNVPLQREYPLAPSDAFFAMMGMQPPAWGYSAIYQMELDVVPLRPDWLVRLREAMEEAARGNAWMLGGVYTQGCMENINRNFRNESIYGFVFNSTRLQHINGNAIYVPRPEFVEWMLPLQRKVELGYDYYLFKEMLYDRNFNGRGLDNFQRTPLMLDCKPTVSHSGNSVPTEEIARRYPDAVVAHTRFVDNDPSTKTVLREPVLAL